MLPLPNLSTYASLIRRIPSRINNLIAGAVPAILVGFIGGYRGSVHEIHHGLLATAAGRFVVPLDKTFNSILLINHSSLSRLITDALKNRVGKS